MKNFDSIFEKMSNNYSELEQIMGDLYQQIQNDPVDEHSQLLLQGLGNVAKGIISSQRDFAVAYCDSQMKDMLVARLDEKEESLVKALESSQGKTM